MTRTQYLALRLFGSARPALRDIAADLAGARECRRHARRLPGRVGLGMRKDAAMLFARALAAGRVALGRA